jgi:hypothetical protein
VPVQGCTLLLPYTNEDRKHTITDLHNRDVPYCTAQDGNEDEPGKEKVKVKFTLEQATKAQRGVEVYLYSFFNLGARWCGWSTPRPGRFTPGKEPVPAVNI